MLIRNKRGFISYEWRVLRVEICSVLLFAVSSLSQAGNFNSPAAVTDSASKMYSVDDIYHRLNAGTAGDDPATKTTFAEPAGSPASLSKDLNDVMGQAPVVDDATGATTGEVANGKKFWSLQSGNWGVQTGSATITTYPAVVPKTGQNLCYKTDGSTGTIPCDGTTGQDGDTNMQKGISHASPRFTKNVNTANDDGGFTNNGSVDGIASDGLCNGSETCNGTVTDNSTGLIWLSKANCIATDNAGFDADGRVSWAQAFTFITGINDGTYNCADISETSATATHQTDWRLPNVKELHSLIDFQYVSPALSNTDNSAQWVEGDPFSSVQSYWYWSSTTYVSYAGSAWIVNLNFGNVGYVSKPDNDYVWPVRAGQ